MQWARDIIVADDGSDFDVRDEIADWLWEEHGRFAHYIVAGQRSPDERMATPSCGALLNRAIRWANTEYIAILCDDDLFAPDWLQTAARALDDHPEWHMVRGEWGLFNDGELPDPTRLCEFTFMPALTAGNFVYRRSCATEEGCWWLENSLAVHDGPMLAHYIQVHSGGYQDGARPRWLGSLKQLAGYRREHPKTVSNLSLFGGDRYLPSAEALFAAGAGGME